MLQLVKRQADDVAIHSRHTFQTPVLGVFPDHRIERAYFTDRTLKERPREALLLRIGPLPAQESRDHVLGRVFSQFPLKKHL